MTGFKFFNDRTIRRFILILRLEAYDLVEKIGFDKVTAQKLVPISKNFNVEVSFPPENIEKV